MRYRVGEAPPSAQSVPVDDMLVLTCIIGIIVGLVLTWAGWRGRQWWLVFWCGGLIPISIATIIWEVSRS